VTAEVTRINSSTARYFVTYASSVGGSTATTLQGKLTGINYAGSLVIKNTVSGAVANGDATATGLRCEWWP
jgi:hypothetical protein